MANYHVTISLTTPEIRTDQAAAFGVLPNAQKNAVKQHWMSQISVTGLPIDFNVSAASRLEVIAEMYRRTTASLAPPAQRIVAVPIESAFPGSNLMAWQSCGPGCHYGPKALAEHDPDRLTFLSVTSNLHTSLGPPWVGIVLVEYRIQAL